MRYRIFTEDERKTILEFINTRKRSERVNLICHRVSKHQEALMADFRLLLALKRLMGEGY
jgi:hypothetical protein